MAKKRDPELEVKVQKWMEDVIGEKFNPDLKYDDNLKDGVLICKLMNKLSPGSITKIEERGSGFVLRQNIDRFQKAVKSYGVATEQVFQTVDLFEKKNIGQVTACLIELDRQSKLKNASNPHIE
ncbi:hypothetical protein ACOME3_005748 [Neoechinorhynchus agilis]